MLELFKIPGNVKWEIFGPFILLISLNIIFGVFTISTKTEKKSIVRIFEFILSLSLLGFFIYISYANNNCQDYDGYKYVYYDGFHKDKGYTLITAFFSGKGVSFEVFRLGYYIVGYILIYISLMLFKVNKNFTLALYALFPWCFHAFQMRTFMSFSIVLLGSTTLLLNGKKKIIGVPLFLIFLYLGYSIHVSVVLYGLFITIFLTSSKYTNYFIGFGFLFSIVLVLFYFNGQDFFVEFVPDKIYSKYFNSKAYSVNVPNVREYLPLLKCMILLVISSFSSYVAFNGITVSRNVVCIYDKEDIKVDNGDYKRMKCIFYMSLCVFSLVPFFTLNTDFFRLERNFFLMTFGLISIAARHSKLKFFDPAILLSIVSVLYGAYILIDFSNGWEWGGINSFFWIFFV